MSLLIKGMDMPENYALCFLRDDFHNYCPYEKNKETDCPLVEVKTPHGDLISKDSVIKRALMFEKFTGSKLYMDMVHNFVGSETPVIEAEE